MSVNPSQPSTHSQSNPPHPLHASVPLNGSGLGNSSPTAASQPKPSKDQPDLLEVYKARIASLQQEDPMKLFSMEGLQMQNEKLKLEMKRAEFQVAQTARLRNERDDFRQKFEQEKTRHEQVRAKTAELEASAKKSADLLRAAEDDKSRALASKRKVEKDFDEFKDSAKRQREADQASKAELHRRINEIQKPALKPKASKSEARSSGSDSEEGSIKQPTSFYKKKLREQSALVQTHEETIKKLKKEKEELEANKATIQRLEKEKAGLEAEAAEFTETLDKLQEIITTNETKIQQLGEVITRYDQERMASEQSLAETLQALEKVKTDLESESKFHQTELAKRGDAENQVAALEAKVRGMEDMQQKSAESAARLASENAQLLIQLQSVQAQLKQRQDVVLMLGELTQKYKAMTREIDKKDASDGAS